MQALASLRAHTWPPGLKPASDPPRSTADLADFGRRRRLLDVCLSTLEWRLSWPRQRVKLAHCFFPSQSLSGLLSEAQEWIEPCMTVTGFCGRANSVRLCSTEVLAHILTLRLALCERAQIQIWPTRPAREARVCKQLLARHSFVPDKPAFLCNLHTTLNSHTLSVSVCALSLSLSL